MKEKIQKENEALKERFMEKLIEIYGEFMTIKLMAEWIDMDERSIRRNIKNGNIKGALVEGQYKINTEQIRDFIF
ncbi:hypothetical protein SAMN02745174_00975 [Cetobacterium ceti]|uniref:Helix-turn-helix domain-containing protein n=1 Tax=Cetobacterium ceti TaxID=180163 RepID=A0A1T4LUJ6_9FUSO|nr:hypothetical protein [Cetobacterium ceti]SJZ58393.1 hypothetical protein SAMN02745174_00975 [Cetobacterium ceti]